MRILIIITLIFLISGFQNEKKSVDVHYSGTLNSIMQQGDLSAKISLDSLSRKRNLYALGALEDLKGEILILDGVPCISYEENDQIKIDRTFKRKASLLIYAQVKKWKEFRLPITIRTYRELEYFIGKTAEEYGMDMNKPFPFKLEGTPISTHWHIVNADESNVNQNFESHRNSGLEGIAFEGRIEALGFYSRNHQGVFTHQSSNMHIHFRNKKATIAAHVDEMKLVSNMILLLPYFKN